MFDIDLVQGVQVTVHVVDAEGSDVQDVAVTIGTGEDAASSPFTSVLLGSQMLQTQADGRAAFNVLPGISTIRIPNPRSYYEPEPIHLEVAGDTTFQVVLQSGPLLTGSVRDEGSEMITSGTLVLFSLTEGREWRVDVRDGYALTLRPGNYRAWFESSRFGSSTNASQHLGDFAITGDRQLDLVVRSGTAISGRIIDADGSAVPGARLQFDSLEGEGQISANADVHGSYSARLMQGAYRVVVGGDITTQWVGNIEVQEEVRVDFHLREGSVLEGQVVDVSTADLSNVSVSVSSVDGAVRGRTRPDPQGLFQIYLPPASYRIDFSRSVGSAHVTWSAGQVEMPRKEPIVLSRPKGAHLSGRVTDAAGNEVEASLWLMRAPHNLPVRGLDDFVASLWSDADGSYELETEPGVYDIVVLPISDRAGGVFEGVELSGDTQRDLVLPVLDVGYRLWGRVFDELGQVQPRSQLQFYNLKDNVISQTFATRQGMYAIDFRRGRITLPPAKQQPLAAPPLLSAVSRSPEIASTTSGCLPSPQLRVKTLLRPAASSSTRTIRIRSTAAR